jgi:hypothetical protein
MVQKQIAEKLFVNCFDSQEKHFLLNKLKYFQTLFFCNSCCFICSKRKSKCMFVYIVKELLAIGYYDDHNECNEVTCVMVCRTHKR